MVCFSWLHLFPSPTPQFLKLYTSHRPEHTDTCPSVRIHCPAPGYEMAAILNIKFNQHLLLILNRFRHGFCFSKLIRVNIRQQQSRKKTNSKITIHFISQLRIWQKYSWTIVRLKKQIKIFFETKLPKLYLPMQKHNCNYINILVRVVCRLKLGSSGCISEAR